MQGKDAAFWSGQRSVVPKSFCAAPEDFGHQLLAGAAVGQSRGAGWDVGLELCSLCPSAGLAGHFVHVQEGEEGLPGVLQGLAPVDGLQWSLPAAFQLERR